MDGLRVLIVEDDAKLSRFLSRALEEEGFAVTCARSGLEALARSQDGSFDAVLLDWMLPELDGDRVCKRLRDEGNTVPILMLTARTDVADRVRGLDGGADDYIGKPFQLEELLARIRAVVRRRNVGGAKVLSLGPVTVDVLSRAAEVNGKALDLTLREFDLLVLFLRNAGQIVSRAQMLEEVWHTQRDPGSNLIEVNISNLREKLGPFAGMLATVRGRGYRFALPDNGGEGASRTS